MKIKYKPTINEQILKAFREANREGREIEYIEVTEKEALDIFHSNNMKISMPFMDRDVTNRKIRKVHGSKMHNILIKVEGQ